MRRSLILLCALVAAGCIGGDEPSTPDHLDPKVESRVDALLSEMTLAEKLRQMHGDDKTTDANGMWRTPGVERLGVPGLSMAPGGPRGVGDNPLGTGEGTGSAPTGNATAFPVPAARGASWNPALERKIGRAIGRECAAKTCNVLLAPVVNVLRHPRWGRAQETYGEDPHHLARMGVAMTEGAQEHVMASVKHFVANSIEDTRFNVNVQMDERTLREVYLPAFRAVVQEADVASVMTAYNKTRGEFNSENAELLGILKDDWGFAGFVESDWHAGVRSTVPAANAGLDIEMPAPRFFGDDLRQAVKAGEVPRSAIDDSVRRILRRQLEYGLVEGGPVEAPPTPSRDVVESEEHLALARRAAVEGSVLLENAGDVLPLDAGELDRLVLAGSLADTPNIGGDGSSDVEPSHVVTPLEGLRAALEGPSVSHVAEDDTLSDAERAELAAADAAVVVAGLTAEDEGEFIPNVSPGDRDSLRLSDAHVSLIEEVAAANPRTIVILEGGSAITVKSWIDAVPALVMAWYPGMEGGHALADLLLGKANFSGKLPVTVPKSPDQLPHFDNDSLEVYYDYFHGYRFLDRYGFEPRYPFGFGLSYTSYSYDALTLERSRLGPDGTLRARVEVTNTGAMRGEEIVQLYIGFGSSSVTRPVRALEAFDRVELEPGETKRVTLRVPVRDLAYWSPAEDRWVVEPMTYDVRVGPSSRTLPLRASFTVAR